MDKIFRMTNSSVHWDTKELIEKQGIAFELQKSKACRGSASRLILKLLQKATPTCKAMAAPDAMANLNYLKDSNDTKTKVKVYT